MNGYTMQILALNRTAELVREARHEALVRLVRGAATAAGTGSRDDRTGGLIEPARRIVGRLVPSLVR